MMYEAVEVHNSNRTLLRMRSGTFEFLRVSQFRRVTVVKRKWPVILGHWVEGRLFSQIIFLDNAIAQNALCTCTISISIWTATAAILHQLILPHLDHVEWGLDPIGIAYRCLERGQKYCTNLLDKDSTIKRTPWEECPIYSKFDWHKPQLTTIIALLVPLMQHGIHGWCDSHEGLFMFSQDRIAKWSWYTVLFCSICSTYNLS